MKLQRKLSKWPGGFTLVELLVSIAVLVLLIVFVAQLTSSATNTTGVSSRHMDADTQARLVFTRIADDFGKMVKRNDVDYSMFKQPSGTLPLPPYGSAGAPVATAANLQAGSGAVALDDSTAFYAETTGYYSGASPSPTGSDKAFVSLVAYSMAPDQYNQNGKVNVFRRLGKMLGWDTNSNSWGSMTYLPSLITSKWPNLFSTTSPDPDFQTVGNTVLRFEYNYLLKSNYTDAANAFPAKLSITPWWDSTMTKGAAHTSVDGFRDVAAIVVAIAVLDAKSRVVVQPDKLAAFAGGLPDAVDASVDTVFRGDIAQAWQTKLQDPQFAASAGVPIVAASAIRIYQRYFYLNASP